ncbi:MAG: hypothetical protein MJZ11_12500 [Lachnospiraceae bacterium]|nr:hypothetical protein [Lachnospiraceae bacterium]
MKHLFLILFLISSYYSIWACECINSTDSLYKDAVGHLVAEVVEEQEKSTCQAKIDSEYHHVIYIVRDNKERLEIDTLNGYKVIQPISIDYISREHSGFIHVFKMKGLALNKNFGANFHVVVEEICVNSKDWSIVGGTAHVFCYKYSESTNCFSYQYNTSGYLETRRLKNIRDNWDYIFR